jgi:GNAT superfamily N-acetyltransferase
VSGLRIRRVEGGADLRAFIRFPWCIYRGRYPDPNWVPPLLTSERALLDRNRSPFFEHGDAVYLLAEREGRPVGRIAGIVNDQHVAFQQEEVGFFGFFECFEDPKAAEGLVEEAGAWVAERGLKVMRGPMNFSTNESCGLLIEGFDTPPTVLMTHNPSFYAHLLTGTGLQPVKTLLSYEVTAGPVTDKVLALASQARERAGLSFRPINMKRFREEVDQVKSVYNEAWERNWGFVPMTDAEFEHLAADLKPVLDPDLVLLAFVDGEMAGFSLAVPDVNQILIRMNGRLLPFGWLRLMRGLKKVDRARVVALGVREKFRRLGLGSLFYSESMRVGLEKGYRAGEASWILEDNLDMRRPIEQLGGKINKKYAIYEKLL